MKLIEHFDAFLKDVGNLNQSRIDLLETRVDAVRDFLRASDFRPRIYRFSAQGSRAVKTIIKPPNGNDFDADELVITETVEGWAAQDYINDLLRVFKVSDRYKSLAKKGTRCVTLDYANDFHLDIVICIRCKDSDRVWFVVCNSKTNEFELTDGEGFAEWFDGRNTLTGGTLLRKTTRLVKYQRDIKQTFSAKSVLLATLLGTMVYDWDDQQRGTYFSDVPTALKTIVGRLDDWLQTRPLMPIVTNPALPSENFTRHWDQDKYANFRDKIHQYRDWIDDAFAETDRSASIAKWQKVFGDQFARGEAASKSASFAQIQVLRSAAIASPPLRPWSSE